MAVKGIDVSSWQGNIDFKKVKASGVEFVIIRSGYGNLSSQKDNYFDRNYTNAKAAGLKIGTYWYSYASSTSDAVNEAKACLTVIKGKKFDLPVFFDLEESSQFSKGKSFCDSIIQAFCNEIKKNGYSAGLYCSTSPLNSYVSASVASKYPLWVAQYNSTCTYKAAKYQIWQYSDKGSVNGISGGVDMNYLYDTSIYIKTSSTSSSNTTSSTTSSTTKGTTTPSTTKTITVTVSDRDKFLEKARTYIGKNGYYVCQTKLKLGAVYDWCCFAVSSIMKDCGFIPKYQPDIYGVAPYPARYGDGKTGTWFKKGSKTPQPGDLIFFFYDGCPVVDKYSCSHIGIVEKVNGDTLTTLEGNVQGYGSDWAGTSTFARCTRYISNSSVHSFFRPNWGTSTVTKTQSSSTSSTTSSTTKSSSSSGINVTYQVHTCNRWQPNVKNTDDYAGVENNAIRGVYANLSKGHIKYRVKLINGNWLPWVQDREDFAGATKLNKNIDCIQMQLVGLNDYAVEYRVSTTSSTNYLPWVRNYNNTNDDGYAGIIGKSIDKLQIRIVKK